MQVAAGVFAGGWRRVGEVQEEIDGETEQDQRQERLVFVMLAMETHIRERGE